MPFASTKLRAKFWFRNLFCWFWSLKQKSHHLVIFLSNNSSGICTAGSKENLVLTCRERIYYSHSSSIRYWIPRYHLNFVFSFLCWNIISFKLLLVYLSFSAFGYNGSRIVHLHNHKQVRFSELLHQCNIIEFTVYILYLIWVHLEWPFSKHSLKRWIKYFIISSLEMGKLRPSKVLGTCVSWDAFRHQIQGRYI